jgi:protein-tyrosine phosphatase
LLNIRVTPVQRARALARTLRHLPDRMLHGRRRRLATAALARSSNIRSVLFICHGNICRSPYAAAAFRTLLPPSLRGHVEIGSAGFIGPDRPPPAESLLVAGKRGIDLASHRSSLLSVEKVRRYDLLVVMEERQRRAIAATYPYRALLVLGDLDPEPIDTRTIRDPFAQTEAVFEQSFARIDRCLQLLVDTLYPLGRGRAGRAANQHAHR